MSGSAGVTLNSTASRLALLFLLAALPASLAQNPGAVGEKCEKETNVTQSDIENYKKLRLPTTREGKCYGACVMKAVGLMTNRGKIDEKKSVDIATSYLQKEMDVEVISSKVHNCSQRANCEQDECEAFFSFIKCLATSSRSGGRRGKSANHGSSEGTSGGGGVTINFKPGLTLSPPPLSFTLLSLSLLG